jgi:hypothetical protein
MLGAPFVIMPALGYGRNGVLLDATSEADLARSVAQWPDAHYLLQRRIVPRLLGGEPAYFRVYHVFGTLFHCWWNCFTDGYRELSLSELAARGLEPLSDMVRRIASLTGMTFFSTEIAQAEDGSFTAIDYVNDQCHLATQFSAPRNGVPDAVVATIARRLVEGSARWLGKA